MGKNRSSKIVPSCELGFLMYHENKISMITSQDLKDSFAFWKPKKYFKAKLKIFPFVLAVAATIGAIIAIIDLILN